jgi:hypothetical protein
MMLDNIDRISAQIATLDDKIQDAVAPFAHQVNQLCEISGVDQIAARELIGEIGVDMSRFPSAAHLVSWAKFCPKIHESASKKKNKSRGKGNPWLGGTIGRIVFGFSRSDGFPAPDTGGCPNAAAHKKRSSPQVIQCSPSSTTCCLTPPATSPLNSKHSPANRS